MWVVEIFWEKLLQVWLGGVIVMVELADERRCMVFAWPRGVLSWSLLETRLLTPNSLIMASNENRGELIAYFMKG